MTAYIIRRLLLIVPTLFGIMLINFLVIQAAPGGPIEQLISRYTGTAVDATARISGSNQTEAAANRQLSGDRNLNSKYRGAQGIDPAFLQELEVMYGFDKPAHKNARGLLAVRLRGKFFSRPARSRFGVRKNARLDLFGPVDDPLYLYDFHSPWHP